MPVYRNNTIDVVAVGLRDSSGVKDTTATATFSVFDTDNIVVTGLDTVVMTYNAGTHEYTGVIPHTAPLTDSTYYVKITITSLDGSVGNWVEKIPVRERKSS